jgi:hypothetical protein
MPPRYVWWDYTISGNVHLPADKLELGAMSLSVMRGRR